MSYEICLDQAKPLSKMGLKKAIISLIYRHVQEKYGEITSQQQSPFSPQFRSTYIKKIQKTPPSPKNGKRLKGKLRRRQEKSNFLPVGRRLQLLSEPPDLRL